ncbi:CubicO group peptidase (beta-lactamase class C family) [Friedmanniella endophytica]|uniref:CubicO group peptidase (Beta-lactamase class C family) n=1 Tax=Microlunatus kandeliicorticis TaxID=1759536 RepID=A0A7W3P6D0_9ACTN|nr:serine hydrolase domain-containing protein [Microlunatus kandeliicorticis]MBA8794790.1 CubicO group peptidase (beta-lactamase class C family) [Microlunatus kandeliicorticis]
MTVVQELLDREVAAGRIPGAVALIGRGDDVEVTTAGWTDLERSARLRRDSVFRIASIGKPLLAASAMIMVERGQLGLDDDITRWLPELQDVRVLARPDGPLDETVALARPITVRHLQTFTSGWGFPDHFDWPGVAPLFERLLQGPPQPQQVPAPDEWLRRLATIPLLAQPGERWLYNLSADLLGVLLSRVSGRPLGALMAELLFEPLGMADTGFAFRPDHADRRTSYYRPTAEGGLALADGPDGQWDAEPVNPSGAGGLVSTVDDWAAFGRFLLAGGTAPDGNRLLSAAAVAEMIATDHTTSRQRADADLFLAGQGWGYGGSIDRDRRNPWNRPGRYGWVGGTGTAGYVFPGPGVVAVLLTQVELGGPGENQVIGAFCTHAAEVADRS